MFIESIITYFFLITSMLIFGVNYYYNSNKFIINNIDKRSFWRLDIILPILIFSTIFGMRYDVGVDYFSYLNSYLTKTHVGKNEYLFYFLSDLSWYFKLHFSIYFGIIAFLQILFFYLSFKNNRYLYPFLIFFLFTNGSFLFWMNGIRQALALCIWLYSLKYIVSRNFYMYLLFICIIFMVHRSSIILLIFYPLLVGNRDYFKNIKIQLILLLLAFLLRSIFFTLILKLESVFTLYVSILGDGLYDSYSMENLIDGFVESNGSGLAVYFKLLVNIIIILESKKLKKFYNNKYFIICYFFFFIGILAKYIIPDGAVALSRPFRYFYIFDTIIYSFFTYYLCRNFNKINNKLKYFAMIIAFALIFCLSQFSATKNSHSLFQFYFNNH
ncbi:EpsG family protein [Chryseobacterium taichungense]|uniref:EpsG family protein n=1 Tax=Chryseobacterium taichungense TaxID=295069 RepID=A0A1H7YES9_9FLAO|nr:EpsG family protein [Chryseobacterium taichungense]SEM43828.1 EpsG family protein [Chryseobacterium taichungense]